MNTGRWLLSSGKRNKAVKRRDANLILVSLAAAGGAVFAYSFPVDLLELAIKNSELPAIIPAAAPPLGGTARLIFTAVAACGASVLTGLLLPWNGRKENKARGGVSVMTFQFSKLKALMGRRATANDERPAFDVEELHVDPMPVLRRSDAHPDAPPRAPLFASRDLGHEALPPIHAGNDDDNDPGDVMNVIMRPADEPAGPVVEDITGLAMPRAPDPLPWETVQGEMDRLLAGVRFRTVEDAQADTVPLNVDAEPAEPTIDELIGRLEQGLAKLRAAIDRNPPPSASASPPDTPGDQSIIPPKTAPLSPVETSHDHHDDKEAGWRETGSLTDADLGTALAALRGITARAG